TDKAARLLELFASEPPSPTIFNVFVIAVRSRLHPRLPAHTVLISPPSMTAVTVARSDGALPSFRVVSGPTRRAIFHRFLGPCQAGWFSLVAGRQLGLGVSGFNDSGFVGEHDCLDAVANVELGEYPCDVGLDGCGAEEEAGADLGVREPASQELEDLEFALGEVLDACGEGRVGRSPANVALDQSPCDRGCEERVAACDGSYCVGELGGWCVF